MKYFFKRLKDRYLTRGNDTLYLGALKRIVFIFIIFSFFLFVAFTAWITFMQDQSGKVKVPKIVGVNILEASETLHQRKLNLNIIPVLRDDVPQYTIIQQNPGANTTVKEGRVIDVVVSSGQSFNRVPSFMNKSLYLVKRLFLGQRQDPQVKKLTLARISYVPSDKPVNTIIAQTPAPDTKIVRETPVFLVVSNGFNYKRKPLPNYKNIYFEKAAKELTARDIRVRIKSQTSSAANFGKILGQIPGPGANLAQGDEVTLIVGAGNSTSYKPRAYIIDYIVPRTSDRNRKELKIVVSDAGNERIIYHGDVFPGEKITEAFIVKGLAKYKIFLNNKVVKDVTVQ